MVKMNLRDLSPELLPEELEELDAAERKAPVFDADSPAMTPEQLQQFKRINRENRTKPTISLRISPATLKKQSNMERGIQRC